MKRGPAVAIAATLALSCSKSEKGSGQPEEQPAPPPPTADAKSELADPSTMFRGDEPDLPHPLQALRLGMSKEEAVAAGVYQHLEPPAQGNPPSKLYRGVSYDHGSYWNDAITYVIVWIDDHDSRETLIAKWGEPIVKNEGDGKRYWWFNPDKRMRVQLTEQNPLTMDEKLQYEEYTPLGKLIDESKRMSFERIPLVGAEVEEIERAYGAEIDAGAERPTLTVAPVEWNRLDTPLRLHVEKQRVVGYHFLLRYDRQTIGDTYTWDLEAQIPEQFVAALGKPKTKGKKLMFVAEPRVTLELDAEMRAWRVEVGR